MTSSKVDKDKLITVAAQLWASERAGTGMTAKDAILSAKQLFAAADEVEKEEEEKEKAAAEEKKAAKNDQQHDTRMHAGA